MVAFLYQAGLWLALPFVLLRLCWRGLREPGHRQGVAARFGRPPADAPKGCLWFHAVSAGEAIAIAPVVRTLAEEFPGESFLITTMTPAGAREARRRLGGVAAHCHVPYDFTFAVRGFLDRVQPTLLVLVETELWPNLIGAAHRRGVPVVLANARLSERSARAYSRVPGLTRRLLRQLEWIACQYPDQARRFVALGADPSLVHTIGNVKFDAVLPPNHDQAVEALRTELQLRGRRVWIAASTHPGEDEIVLDAHLRVRERLPDTCLLLVPRHPVRAASVMALAERRGFRVAGAAARSAGASAWEGDRKDAADVLVVGAMGLLQTLYGLSEVAFIGGSLVPKGGHNPIEAALCAKPLIMGPEVFNFAEIAAAFADQGCLTRVRDAPQLAQAVLDSLRNEEAGRAALGQSALQAVKANGGASQRLLCLLRGTLDGEARCNAVATGLAAASPAPPDSPRP